MEEQLLNDVNKQTVVFNVSDAGVNKRGPSVQVINIFWNNEACC